MNPYTEKVKRGADLLDRERPGWRDRIDLASLDLGSGCRCILGQVFGTYYDGLSAIIHTDLDLFCDYEAWITSIDFQITISHGFSIDHHSDERGYQVLQEAWVAELSTEREERMR